MAAMGSVSEWWVRKTSLGEPPFAAQAGWCRLLAGDFRRAATLYDREQANVALSTEDGDNFIRNMVTIRAEERLGLEVKNSTALSLGDFGNVV
jgi:HK97 family phage major capsid protein